MTRNPNRKILIRLALVLCIIVLADQLIISNGMTPSETESRIAFLRAELERAAKIDLLSDQEKRLQEARAHISAPLSARQQYLESLIGPDFIVLVDPGLPTEVPDWPGRSLVTFKLRLRMTLVELCGSLAALDADNQPLRVERLRIIPVDEQRKMLQVEMTVATITETTPAPAGTAVTPAATIPLQPEPRKLPEGPLKNIFFPVIDAAVQVAQQAEVSIRPFTLVGVDLGGVKPRAMLLFPQTGETAWMEPEASIDAATLVEIDAGGAVFRVGGDLCRLNTGEPSDLLLLGKRTFKSNCTLLGVVRNGRQWLAMAMFSGSNAVTILGVGDVLPTGRIVAIGEESITLDRGGYEDIVRVGHASDNPVYPGMGVGYE